MSRRLRSPEMSPDEHATVARLESRLGPAHIRRRLELEQAHETRMLRRGARLFHPKRWLMAPGLIDVVLTGTGLRRRGSRNAARIRHRLHDIALPHLPAAFEGFTILHLTDLHVDISPHLLPALIETLGPLRYDLCVLTGDYRGATYGPFAEVLDGMARLRPHLSAPTHAVLGNHDSLRMVPPLEAMGYRMLLNEWTRIERDGAAIFLSGIDDAHLYDSHDIDRAARDIPRDAVSILLSHTPETYRQAAHAGFDAMLSGHTHGGQICLPGGVPLFTDADCPRAFARGSWRYRDMIGYTSVGAGCGILDARFNCPPEVTTHRLRRAA